MEMLHQLARGEGFGKVIGLGIRRLKKLFADEYGADPGFVNDIGMECKGMEYSEYVTKNPWLCRAAMDWRSRVLSMTKPG